MRSDIKGHGLGTALMRHLIDYAGAEGLGRLEGLVLRENVRMLTLCRELGFAITDDSSDPLRLRVTLPLAAVGGTRA